MKKMLKLLGIAALFAAVLGFFGCNNEDDSKDPEIKSIAVKTNPTKVTYTADEKFDPTGLVLTVKWTEGKADTEVKYADAKAKFTFAPALTAALKTTDTKVTVTYEKKTADIAITVTAATTSDPTDPSNPADPSDPADPTTPSDPTTPADPTTPSDPATPTDPSDPETPADPADPTDPTDPTPASKLPWTGTEVILNAETFAALKGELGDGVDGKSTKEGGEYTKEKAKATGIDNLKALWASKESSKDLDEGKTYIGFYTASYDEENSKDVPAVAKVADDALLVYSEGLGNLRMRESGTINYNGDSKRYIGIDTSILASSGSVKVTFSVKASTSGKGNANSYVFLSSKDSDMPKDSAGTAAPNDALASKTFTTVQVSGVEGEAFDISATVDAGTKVYLFFSRSNSAQGGGIDVTEIKVEAAE